MRRWRRTPRKGRLSVLYLRLQHLGDELLVELLCNRNLVSWSAMKHGGYLVLDQALRILVSPEMQAFLAMIRVNWH